jgi:hypothetical protein
MPTNTYIELDKITVSGNSTTSVTLSGISGNYTDLRLVIHSQNQNNTNQPYIQFNSDTGTGTTNYSTTSIRGDGSTGASGRHSNNIGWYPVPGPGVGTTGNFQPWLVDIIDYSNTTTYKSGVSRFNNSSSMVSYNVHSWRITAAITSITITAEAGAGYIVAGSTFSLYGIKKFANEVTPKATGGNVYEDSTYYYHAFPYSGTFTPNQSLTADILVVAGGGAGGGAYFGPVGGGGGAGGMQTFTSQSLSATNYTCTVGAGGKKTYTNTSENTNGGNSQFGALTASVGGGAAGEFNNTRSAGTGANGGSGGGGAGNNGSGGGLNAATGTAGQGNNGGTGGNTDGSGAGGGGGKGAVGANRSGQDGGAGGIGATTAISGGSATNLGHFVNGNYYFAGGGGGGYSNSGGKGGAGGHGGGGAGGYAGANGLVSTGGGGGGGANLENFLGSNGGSGVIIVRYAK